mgnify:CR=1 FL=1
MMDVHKQTHIEIDAIKNTLATHGRAQRKSTRRHDEIQN